MHSGQGDILLFPHHPQSQNADKKNGGVKHCFPPIGFVVSVTGNVRTGKAVYMTRPPVKFNI